MINPKLNRITSYTIDVLLEDYYPEDPNNFAIDVNIFLASLEVDSLESIAGALKMSCLDLLTGVDFAGEKSEQAYPASLQEFINDEEYKSELNQQWINLLNPVELYGKRPRTKREWVELYLHLKRTLEYTVAEEGDTYM